MRTHDRSSNVSAFSSPSDKEGQQKEIDASTHSWSFLPDNSNRRNAEHSFFAHLKTGGMLLIILLAAGSGITAIGAGISAIQLADRAPTLLAPESILCLVAMGCAIIALYQFITRIRAHPAIRHRQQNPNKSKRTRRPRLLLTSAILLTMISILCALAETGGDLILLAGLPQQEGALVLPGLDYQVTITRDGYGVPHIFARDQHDLAEADGFVTASDRYAQMDGAWRLAAGQLSAAYGPGPGESYIQIDTFMRSLSLDHASELECSRLDPSARLQLNAYSAGVNAYLATHPYSPPLEYVIGGTTPSAWTPIKTLDVMRYFSFGFSDWFVKLVYGTIATQGNPAILHELYPSPPSTLPTILGQVPNVTKTPGSASVRSELSSAMPSITGIESTQAVHVPLLSMGTALAKATVKLGAIASVLGLAGGHMGSNNWALDATRTATGGALQAGDPHVPTSFPAVWYQIALQVTQPDTNWVIEDTTGATLPGVPGIILGQTLGLAFSPTISDLSDADLYVLNTQGCSPDQYHFDGGCRPFLIRHETLSVAGAPARALSIFTTQEGATILPVAAPITSSGTAPLPQIAPGMLLALRSTLTDPTLAITNIFAAATATTWAQFIAATDDLPLGLNWVVALRSGQIGYRMSGVLPLRPLKNVWEPVDGGSSANRWRGYAPQSSMPRILPGRVHQLVTANNPAGESVDGMLLGAFPDQGYRAQRITTLLDQLPAHGATVTAMERIQNDVRSLPAAILVPAFLSAGNQAGGDAAQAAQFLRGWDEKLTIQSTPGAVYELTLANFVRALITQTLGATLATDYVLSSPDEGSAPTAVAVAAATTLAHQRPSPQTAEGSVSVARLIAQAEQTAIAQLRTRFGADPHRWRWGAIHPLLLAEPGFSTLPLLGEMFSLPAVSRPGDECTIDMGGNYGMYLPPSSLTALPDAEQTFGPFYRQVMDLADPNASVWILAPGESGQPFSPHRADQLAMWNQGSATPLAFTKEALSHQPGTSTLYLLPR